MNVSEFIEWLQTMPQGAKIQVLSHTSGSGYYDQGGNCKVVDFEPTGLWRHSEDFYIDGLHFEMDTLKEVPTLQLGVKDK